MITFESLLPEVNIRAIGCPEPTALLALRRGAEEFCRRSWAWQETLEDVEWDDGRVVLSPPSGARLLAVARVKFDGWAVPQVFAQAAKRLTEARGNVPVSWHAPQPDVIDLFPLPYDDAAADVVGRLEVMAALAPSDKATGVPDFVGGEFSQALVFGALYFLATLPGQPFSDPDKAALYRQEFLSGVGRARQYRASGYGDSTMRVKPHPLVR